MGAQAWRNRIVGEGEEAPEQLLANPQNWRTHSGAQKAALSGVLREVGVVQRVIVNRATGYVVDGHARIELAMAEKQPTIPVLYVELTEQEEALILASLDPIGAMAGKDAALLGELLQQVQTQDAAVRALLDDLAGDQVTGRLRLADAFGVPPFSVLNAREGAWQERKQAWNALIGDDGETREATLHADTPFHNGMRSVSLLDATLAELMCRWFAKPGWAAFDPFAGDTVFGFVSSTLGLSFRGIELRQEQAELNQRRCRAAGLDATYFCDTAVNMDAHIADGSVDFLFSCPPYADLEVYSDNPLDLSTMPHEQFMAEYSRILGNTYAKLRDNRFAVIVTSEVRDDRTGGYIALVPATIAAMQQAGYAFWNELILVTMIGNLPKRAGGPMQKNRKVARAHQNVLVFLKGDPEQIRHEFGDITAPLCLFDAQEDGAEESRE